MADIGTDHGFLPLYLVEQGISPRVIMCDISGPSLDKAREAAVQYGITEGVSFREGDGLKVLEAGGVDAVVIAGMGGHLMTQILGSDPDKTVSFRKYILQPRNHAGLLRKWLTERGFTIKENGLVREGKFICEVITVFAPKTLEIGDFEVSEASWEEGDPRWDLPEDICSADAALPEAYAALKAAQECKKLEGLQKSKNADQKEIKKIEQRIDYFRRFAK